MGIKLETAYVKAYGEELGTKRYNELIAAAKEAISPKKENASEGQETQTVQQEKTPLTQETQAQTVQQEVSQQSAEQAPVEDYTVRKKTPQENEAPESKGPQKNSFIWRLLDDMEKSDDPAMDLFVSIFKMAFKYASGNEEFNQKMADMEKDPKVQDVVKDKETPIKEAPLKEEVRTSEPAAKDPLALSLDSLVNADRLIDKDVKIKTSAEIKYDQMLDGKETLTLKDLEKAGVNMKTDLQPTLKALMKDDPSKQASLIPEGLGNENTSVSKEFAVALIQRVEQREAIARHQSMQRA